MSYDNPKYLQSRYRELRAAGLCTDCKQPAGKFARCRKCRERVNAVPRKAAA